MRLLKTHSHTSERSGYEARKNAKTVVEVIAVTIIRQTTRQKPAAYRQCGGGGETKKALWPRQTTVKTLPRTVSVAGGKDAAGPADGAVCEVTERRHRVSPFRSVC